MDVFGMIRTIMTSLYDRFVIWYNIKCFLLISIYRSLNVLGVLRTMIIEVYVHVIYTRILYTKIENNLRNQMQTFTLLL